MRVLVAAASKHEATTEIAETIGTVLRDAGMAVDVLPAEAVETHVSLFDGTNCGLELKGRPVFSVQYHPEASPGPQDSHYLFTRFVNKMRESKGKPPKPER